MAATTIVDRYSVGLKNNPIKLKVSMSSKMDISRSTVRINKQDPQDFDDSFEMNLGTADNLIGSKMTIDTTETNTDKTQPGATDFFIKIEGGPTPYSNSKSQTVAAGDAVLYTVEITFLP